MIEIDFREIEAAVSTPVFAPKVATDPPSLFIPEAPLPFIRPKLHQLGTAANLTAEILLIQAPAAVGKSTLARHLSATRRVPLLNLAEVRVATGSLRGLVSELEGPTGMDAIQTFHAGRLPIVIDAIDEGKLLSGEGNIESFLESAGAFILSDRSVTNAPKLIIFGRSEAAEEAQILLELATKGDVTWSTLEVAFFGEAEAREVIDAYAKKDATGESQYLKNPGPAKELVTTYFGAIEKALGLGEGELWTIERGRRFAGYAPVLAAIGKLLAKVTDYGRVVALLRGMGPQDAWTVIETVLGEILDRERGQLCEKLAPQASAPLPEETFDRQEQLALLNQHVHGQTLTGTGRVVLPAQDRTRYEQMIANKLSDHPFVNQREFRDDVLGGLVLASAVANDLLRDTDMKRLASASWQPFLWRSFVSQLKEGALLDGCYVGSLLSSFWSDPLTQNSNVAISSPEPDVAEIRIASYCNRPVMFRAMVPIVLEGLAKDCKVDLSATLRLQGHALQASRPVFMVQGTTTLKCGTLDIATDAMTLHGQIWIEASAVTGSTERLNVTVKNGGTKIGWGGEVAKRYPWSQIRATLKPALNPDDRDTLTKLIDECCDRLDGVLILQDDFRPVQDDPGTRWFLDVFPDEFPKLIKALKTGGIVTATKMQSQGATQKVRVHFTKSWIQVRDIIRGSSAEGQALLAALKAAVR